MAVVVKGTAEFRGGILEFGTFTLDAASIAAASQGIETVALVGAKVGDICFINPRAVDNRLAICSCKVTAADVLSIYLNNMYDATTAVNGAALTYDYMLVHLS